MNKLAQMVYQAALTKVASRWREAIRSGEIGAESAAKLMKRMGYTEGREIAGLNRGSVRMAKKMGIPLHISSEYATIPEMIRAGRDTSAAPIPIGVRNRMNMASFIPGEGISMDLKLRDFNNLNLTLGKEKKEILSDKNLAATRALILRHEVDEARAGKKLSKKWNDTPTEIEDVVDRVRRSRFYGLNAAVRDPNYHARSVLDIPNHVNYQHMDPSVIYQEIRNGRMLPHTGNALVDLRKDLGHEHELLASVLPVVEGRAQLPKKMPASIKRLGDEHNKAVNDYIDRIGAGPEYQEKVHPKWLWPLMGLGTVGVGAAALHSNEKKENES